VTDKGASRASRYVRAHEERADVCRDDAISGRFFMMLVFDALQLSAGSVLRTSDVRQLDALRGDDTCGSATGSVASGLSL